MTWVYSKAHALDGAPSIKRFISTKVNPLKQTLPELPSYSAQGLTACSLHPGALVTTDIGRGSLAMRIIMQLISPFTKTPNQGASTSVYCAIEADASLVAGKYYSHCQPARMSAEAADEKVAAKLWQLSEDWVASLAKISI